MLAFCRNLLRFLLQRELLSVFFIFLIFGCGTAAAKATRSSVFLSQESYFSPSTMGNQKLQNQSLGAHLLFETPARAEPSESGVGFKTDLTTLVASDQQLSYLNLRELFGSYSLGSSKERPLKFSLDLSLGRKLSSWSWLDDQWQLGLWQPLFFWNPVVAETQGQTGLFVHFGSPHWPHWEITLFGSPLFIPHQRPPYTVADETVSSASRWMPLVPLPSSATLQGQPLPIHYEVAEPTKESVAWQPTSNAKLTLWPIPTQLYFSLVYGSKAAHDPQFRVAEPYLQLQGGSQVVAVTINPEFYRHTLVGIESGWQQPNWDFALSSIQETLSQTPNIDTLYFHYQPLKAWGGLARSKNSFGNLNFSWLKRSQGDPLISGPNQQLFNYAPLINSAALYSNAMKLTFERPPWPIGWFDSSLSGFITLIRDWDWNATVIQSELQLLFSSWSFLVGAELIGVAPPTEAPPISFFSQAQSNDRYYMKVSYLF